MWWLFPFFLINFVDPTYAQQHFRAVMGAVCNLRRLQSWTPGKRKADFSEDCTSCHRPQESKGWGLLWGINCQVTVPVSSSRHLGWWIGHKAHAVSRQSDDGTELRDWACFQKENTRSFLKEPHLRKRTFVFLRCDRKCGRNRAEERELVRGLW